MISREDIVKEANGYYQRNAAFMDREPYSRGIKLFCDFYDKSRSSLNIGRMLEIGCSTGYNLLYLSSKYEIKCHGIDPSDLAIAHGTEEAKSRRLDVTLTQGFSDEIDYEDNIFDCVYVGFCLYQVPRELILKTISEADRVLKIGGY